MSDGADDSAFRWDDNFAAQEILPGLFLGSAFASSNKKQLLAHNITHILNCAQDEPCYFRHCFQYLHLPLEDSHVFRIERYFDKSNDFIADALDNACEPFTSVREEQDASSFRLPLPLPPRLDPPNETSHWGQQSRNSKLMSAPSTNMLDVSSHTPNTSHTAHSADTCDSDRSSESPSFTPHPIVNPHALPQFCRPRHRGILVHCAAGVSRSATLVLAYIMQRERIPFKQALLRVKTKRSCVAPNFGFVAQLMDLEARLFPGLPPSINFAEFVVQEVTAFLVPTPRITSEDLPPLPADGRYFNHDYLEAVQQAYFRILDAYDAF
eukprot:gnl/Trimastix_PCT/2254.p1 GENE.gnl/Trimastix_PCT/2254~~gnl/Trimastix_PCT/2254.p1  ORF type:complete len:324 (+),score=22.77 gnl/Trimastix_PCT/2254:77-1048(+)